jgi:small subunit ribosomal protein S17
MARQLTGTVTSDKTDKTIVISVRERRTHPIYKKQYTVNTKFMAHDAKNQAKVGDLVVIKETRPISARKRFALDKIIEKAGARFQESDATADVPEDQKAVVEAKPEKNEAKEDKE